MKLDIILAGVGGQGTVLASKLLATAAMEKYTTHTAETIGMAQRGGSVVSHVRIGECFSPLIPQKSADIIIGFEPAEAARAIGYLKDGGVVIVSKKAIKPVTASLTRDPYDGTEALKFLEQNVGTLLTVDGEHICEACGSIKVLNVALLGAAAKFLSPCLALEDIVTALKARLPQKVIDMNLKALDFGYNS